MHPFMVQRILNIVLSLFLLVIMTNGCTSAPDIGKKGCRNCHDVQLDYAHNIECTACHRGNANATTMQKAHSNLLKEPASPELASSTCGRCHAKRSANAHKTIHYTLNNEISKIWTAFFPKDETPSLSEIRAFQQPNTPRQLISDMLARRCLRCHVWTSGEDYYSGLKRGTGCAACHLGPWEKFNHKFHLPKMENCLWCHYGNFVGWDYLGRFEKDYPADFRSPLINGQPIQRPFGLEWTYLSKDVHAEAGLSCLSCHKEKLFHPQSSKGKEKLSCRKCHKNLTKRLGHNPLKASKISCAVCHATWGFYDYTTYLLRQDEPDIDDWLYLLTQGSQEVETWQGYMIDKLSNEKIQGIWFKLFKKRRWRPLIIGKSINGNISVLRPLLDIKVSYLDRDDEVIFDNLSPVLTNQWQVIYPQNMKKTSTYFSPYFPHTLGKADIFTTIFIENILNCQESGIQPKNKTDFQKNKLP